MCTVTYLPLCRNAFLLTSSRDEQVKRKAALFPVCTQTAFYPQVLFPQDGEKGGTRIATSTDLTVCLLNGAFTAHTAKPSYRLSLGLVVLALFAYPSAESFLHTYDLIDIEPFTLILVTHTRQIQLTELRWNGEQKHISVKNPFQPYVWSSATLYAKGIIEQRKNRFHKVIARSTAVYS